MSKWQQLGFVQDSDDEDILGEADDPAVGPRLDPFPLEASASLTAGLLSREKDVESTPDVKEGFKNSANSSLVSLSSPSTTGNDVLPRKITTRPENSPSLPPRAGPPAVCLDDPNELQKFFSSQGPISQHGETSLPGQNTSTVTNTENTETDQVYDIFDISSSPLSSAPSSPSPLSSPQNALAAINGGTAERTDPSNSSRTSELIAVVIPDEEPLPSRMRNGYRTFRPRNPIQLHPYLLENERYRQTFRSRGLRPVAFGRDVADESQDAVLHTELGASRGQASSPAFASSQASANHQPLRQTLDVLDHPLISESESSLEDLDTILRRPVAGRDSIHRKRRMLSRSDQEANEHSYKESDAISTIFPGSVAQDAGVENATGSTRKRKRRFRKFKMPREISPVPLPTPEATSELAELHARPNGSLSSAEVSDLEENGQHSLRPVNHRNRDGPSRGHEPKSFITEASLPSKARPDDKDYIRTARRRIKGVLPASWVRLDQQSRKAKPRHQVHKRPSPTKATSPGTIKQPIQNQDVRHRGMSDRGSDSIPFINISSDSERSMDDSPRLKSPTPFAPSSHLDRLEAEPIQLHALDDVEEHDWIDPMHAPIKRRRLNSSKKLQKRLTDIFPRDKPGRVSQTAQRRSDPSPNKPSKRLLPTTHGTQRLNESETAYKDAEADSIVPVTNRASSHSKVHRQSSSREPHRQVLGERSANQQQRIPAGKHKSQERTTRPKVKITPHSSHAVFSRSRAPRLQQTRLNLKPFEPDPGADSGSKSKKVFAKAARKRTPVVASRPARPGQLEDVQKFNGAQSVRSAFQRNLLSLEDNFRQDRFLKRFEHNPVIDRLLNKDARGSETENEQEQHFSNSAPDEGKGRTRTYEGLHRSIAIIDNDPPSSTVNESHVEDRKDCQPPPLDTRNYLKALAALGSSFSNTCDVSPFSQDVCFHSSTFVGSGDLRSALALATRDLETPAGSSFLQINGTVHRWSSWTEEVAAQLAGVARDAERNGKTPSDSEGFGPFLRSLVLYFARNLHFLDAIDRGSFVETSTVFLETMFSLFRLPVVSTSDSTTNDSISRIRIQCLTYVAVLGLQTVEISKHQSLGEHLRSKVAVLFDKLLANLVEGLLCHGGSDLKALLERHRNRENSTTCIQPNEHVAEAVVTAYHILRQENDSDDTFWTYVSQYMLKRLRSELPNTTELEQVWYSLFELLPFTRFDDFGLAKHSPAATVPQTMWTLIKTLLGFTFELYSKLFSYSSSVNSYVRTIISRCHVLIRTWRWKNCESMISCIFDFFAHRGLASLDGENPHGPATFLESLNQSQVLHLNHRDRSFHLFLKVLYTGLVDMHDVYNNKKIRNISWRYIPNHGRVHKKEDDLLEEDLNSLRNHHDLLCILYMASTRHHRISLGLVQNLVKLETSHSEVCRVNVRSWANLAQFELSSSPADETALADVGSWFQSIVEQLRNQHQLARTEAQSFFDSAGSKQKETITSQVLESTIASNERQVEAVWCMAFGCLADILQKAKNIPGALTLMQNIRLGAIYTLFDPKLPRVNPALKEALKVHGTYLDLLERQSDKDSSSDTNDDSQDYGEWPLEEDELNENAAVTKSASEETATEALQDLLSNCFGAEAFADDALLAKVVDTWVHAITLSVKLQRHGWSYYLDAHGPGSWTQLRDTDQARKFHPYFLAAILEHTPSAYAGYENEFVSSWFVSLVDRESMLKYQHQLTSALLNLKVQHCWMQNLPFWKSSNDRHAITLPQLRERRLSTISTVLANIRQFRRSTESAQTEELIQLRLESLDLTKRMMNAMKKNFQETQQGTSMRGSYVDFVQNVVEFLQEYTAEFCSVDEYFTDNVAFPLPSDDPTYVVGRLRSYGQNMAEPATQKKLTGFIIATSERAAIDGHQEYFAEQLLRSLESTAGSDDESAWLLTQFIIHVALPSFTHVAVTTQCGWIMAQPIVKAVGFIFQNILFGSSVTNEESCAHAANMARSFLESTQKAIQSLIRDRSRDMHAGLFMTLRILFDALTATLCPIDYWLRSGVTLDGLNELVHEFEDIAKSILALHGQFATSLGSGFHDVVEPMQTKFDDISTFCRQQLLSTLSKNWARSGDDFFMLRGASKKLAVVDVGANDEERELLCVAVQRFLNVLNSMPSLGGDEPARGSWLADDLMI